MQTICMNFCLERDLVSKVTSFSLAKEKRWRCANEFQDILWTCSFNFHKQTPGI